VGVFAFDTTREALPAMTSRFHRQPFIAIVLALSFCPLALADGIDDELMKSQAVTTQLMERLAEMEARTAALQQEYNAVKAQSEALRAELAKLQAVVEKVTSEADQRQRQIVDMTDSLHKAFSEVKQLKEENARLKALVPEVDTTPSAASQPPATVAAPPVISDARVVKIDADGMIVVSVGKNKRIQIGQTFFVYRQLKDHGIIVGQIEVVELAAATARCKTKSLLDTVKPGDSVSSKL
jgi:hypothetical protein